MKKRERHFCDGTVLSIQVKSAWLISLEEISLEYCDRKGFYLSGRPHAPAEQDGKYSLLPDRVDVSVSQAWADDLLTRIENLRIPVIVYPRADHLVGSLDGDSVELVLNCEPGFQGNCVFRWDGFCPDEWQPLENIVQIVVDRFLVSTKSPESGKTPLALD